ncbi:hypothetical protein [Streptomyces sp. NPDC051561]|uniref:hypothetical protein n=1 Tax=Streptomyces sp. NPDC051561 TaxID=3365658 RepID=UPI0037B393ED
MPVTPIGAAPYPAGADADAVPADLMALAVWASTRVNMNFATAAARDAAIPAPTQGMIAWLQTPGSLTVRTATGWRTLWSQLAWTDVVLSSGYETYGTPPSAAVESGLFINLRGGIQRSTEGAQIATSTIVGYIPSALGTPLSGDYPIATQYLAVAASRLYVGADRSLRYVGPNTGWMGLNGVRIPLN